LADDSIGIVFPGRAEERLDAVVEGAAMTTG
jgi:hypothetical protein